MKAKDVMALIKEKGIQAIDLRFVDFAWSLAALHGLGEGVCRGRIR